MVVEIHNLPLTLLTLLVTLVVGFIVLYGGIYLIIDIVNWLRTLTKNTKH